VCFKIYKR